MKEVKVQAQGTLWLEQLSRVWHIIMQTPMPDKCDKNSWQEQTFYQSSLILLIDSPDLSVADFILRVYPIERSCTTRFHRLAHRFLCFTESPLFERLFNMATVAVEKSTERRKVCDSIEHLAMWSMANS